MQMSESPQPDPGKPESHAVDPVESIAMQFLRELVIFILGILLGFYWHIYYIESQVEEAHIIIGLIVIIICMTRYLFLLKSAHGTRRKDGDD